MTDIKRLHRVQKMYPNVPRREGKTTFCFDMLLRSAQTGAYKHLCYITNTAKASEESLKRFISFLEECNEEFTESNSYIFLCSTRINFSDRCREKETIYNRYDGLIEDYFI